MKRSILIAILTLIVAVNASAQRKVLIEEFTSSTCGPCASTDPLMEEFEKEYIDKIVVLKYHQNYPSEGDIMYTAFPAGERRGYFYTDDVSGKIVHNVGIPWVQFNGVTNKNPGAGVDSLKSITDRVMNLSGIYYDIVVSQELTADSIIAFVTVKSGAEIDPDARLQVVVAEANVFHTASNGRIYHTAAARHAMPPFDATTGGPSGEALTLAPNGEQSFRFSAPLRATYNKGLLQLVAFVQNSNTGMVMGVETNKPMVSIDAIGGTASVVGNQNIQARYMLNNVGMTTQNIKIATVLSKATPYSLEVKLIDGTVVGPNDAITLEGGEEKEIIVNITSSGAVNEIQRYGLSLGTAEGVGITGGGGYAWGADKKDLFVDAGVGSYTQTYQGSAPYQSAITNAGITTSFLSGPAMRDAFSDLSSFKTVFYASGYSAGIFSDNGDMERMRSYVQSGGKLVFSSMVMASAYTNAGLADYPEEVFGVTTPGAVNGGWSELIGVTGDVIGDGVEVGVGNIVITQPLEPSELNATAKAVFVNENDETVGVRAEHLGGGKTVFLSFEPGNISTTTQRRLVVKKIVDWLNGTADVTPQTEVAGFVLRQNYPNPFNPSTEIAFELPHRSSVSLVVQDMMGREVATLIDNQSIDAGSKTVKFDASDLASGNYVYVLTVDGQRLDRKMTLSK